MNNRNIYTLFGASALYPQSMFFMIINNKYIVDNDFSTIIKYMPDGAYINIIKNKYGL